MSQTHRFAICIGHDNTKTVRSTSRPTFPPPSSSDGGLVGAPNATTLRSTRGVREYEVGRFEEGARFLKRLLDTANAAPNWPVYEHAAVAITIPLIARITGVPDLFDAAERAAETYLSSPQAMPRHSMTAQTGLALMAIALGDKTSCERWYDKAISADEFYVEPLPNGRFLGLLAHTIGKLDTAAHPFQDALTFR